MRILDYQPKASEEFKLYEYGDIIRESHCPINLLKAVVKSTLITPRAAQAIAVMMERDID